MMRVEWDIRELKLKPGVVWSMAVSSLRKRLVRTLLTLLTIATSSAFLIFLLTMARSEDVADRQSWFLMMGLAIVVSAAGVLNTMLMSVTQRYREIGTMKCLGALDSFIVACVLLEAAILGLVGAVLGTVAGLGISLLIGLVEHGSQVFAFLDFSGLHWKVLLAILVGMFLTTFGASFPAWIAARMPPMEAMRGEK